MKTLSVIFLLVFIHSLNATLLGKSKVVAFLYDTVILRCSFPFIKGPEGLIVVWEKKDKDGRGMIAHKFSDGDDNIRNQDLNYVEHTELSNEFSQGRVDLTLHGVTFSDEGTYFCRAANSEGHGDKETELTINDLNAADSVVTVVQIDGKKRLKCFNSGVFRNPWVKWYDAKGKALSEHGTRNITDIGGGKKMVESMLDMDVETNKQYFCLVQEGRLKRKARAVISDGKPTTITEIKLRE